MDHLPGCVRDIIKRGDGFYFHSVFKKKRGLVGVNAPELYCRSKRRERDLPASGVSISFLFHGSLDLFVVEA